MPTPKPKLAPRPKLARGPKIADVARALSEANGICAAAAQSLGVSPASLRRRVRRSVTLQRLLGEIAVDNLDLAEAALLQAVREGKLGAVTYYLRTRGQGPAPAAHNEDATPMPSQPATPDADRGAETAAIDLTRLSDDDLRLLDEILAKALPESRKALPVRGRARASARGRKKSPV